MLCSDAQLMAVATVVSDRYRAAKPLLKSTTTTAAVLSRLSSIEWV